MNNLLHRQTQEPSLQHLYLGIPPISFGYVVGPPKSGKTTYCEGLAFSIAAGLKTYLDQPIHTNNSTVLFFSFEEYWRNRIERNKKQIQRLTQGDKSWLNNIHMIDENFPRNLIDEQDWQLIESEIERLRPSVVFIDSLSRCYTGSIEDSKVAKELTNRLRELIQKHQICLILIHHTPKQIGRPLTIDSIAGSRILAQEADFAIGISKTLSGQRYLKPIFYRYAQEEEQVQCFQITEDLWLHTTEINSEASLLIEPAQLSDPNLTEDIMEFISTHCKDHPHIETKTLQQEFVETGEISKPTLHTYLKKLIQAGRLIKIKHGQYEIGTKINS